MPSNLSGLSGRLRATAIHIFPGLAVALLIAVAAKFIAEEYGGPVMLFSLLIGMALGVFGGDQRTRPGVMFAGSRLLRVGVALLGARIGADEIASLGAGSLILVLAGVVGTIAIGLVLARVLSLGRERGILTGGATAICGASAALAISAAMPDRPGKERDTLFTIIAVTALSTLAMVVYPLITRLFGFDDVAAGLFIGGSIHDVAQVVGAGYTISETAGDTATLTKLFRVAMLAPVVLTVAFAFRERGTAGGLRGIAPPPMLVGFIALALLHTFGLLPPAAVALAATASSWLLVIAVAAIGVRTNLSDLRQVGWRPLVLVVCETLFLLAVLLIGTMLLHA
ncbi:putative sulfate exporter family transporter [Acuticoccus sp. MNP-M23]|uniref:YeiH family protein n=1 Tax=Acuticoccus sp. MNP-M23 TaxID=3072793 RepID=UPI0028159F81|nr:putative sulfate exporter family transporter [Acuticoccus sp. MNP-M23]WMS44962.1 putative sulfate exporter family transporter [Acuticoccus sp. MNP-M23]